MRKVLLNSAARAAWQSWLDVNRSKCHLHYTLEGGTLETHIQACTTGAQTVAQRIAREIAPASPLRILEVGCSAGFNCLALADQFPAAQVTGIEPDQEAVELGQVMARESGFDNVTLIHGVGENMPFEDSAFDLIVCHTVIEHVQSVPDTIREMGRVLAADGVIHLEAPNYFWPYEPHVDVWCFPLLGKPLARLFARLQGRADKIWYLGHLQFVYPGRLERLFAKNGLTWHNRVRDKIRRAAGGDEKAVQLYHGPRKILAAFHRWGLLRLAEEIIIRSGLYPSVLYTLRKKDPP